MIRIVYRWRVQKSNATKFKAVWARTTKAIRAKTPGARGSVLLESHRDPTEFMTIARWDQLEDWLKFWEHSSQSDMKEMHSLAERLTEEVYEEIDDHTI